MSVPSPLCLTDLLPALRWSRPQHIAEILADPRLPDGWWSTTPLPRVSEVAGPTWLYGRVSRLPVERFDHIPLGDLLPTLRFLTIDPRLPDWPDPIRTAVLDNAGDWSALLDSTAAAMLDWRYPPGIGSADVIAAVLAHVLEPLLPAGGEGETPPAVANMLGEAVHTLAAWLPAHAPEPVRAALAYLIAIADVDNVDALPSPQPPPAAAPAPPPAPPRPPLRAEPTGLPERQSRHSGRTDTGSFPRTETGSFARTETGSFPRTDTGSFSRPDTGSFARPAASGTGSFTRPAPPVRREPGAPPALPEPAHAPAPPTRTFPAVPAAPLPAEGPATGSIPVLPPARPTGQPLVDLVDSFLREWDDLQRVIAVERLFSNEPASIRVLADRLRVDVSHLRNAQRGAEERLMGWLGSPAAGPLSRHLADLADRLGTVATVDHLVAAHPAHSVEVPALGTPLWRILLTLLPDRRMTGGWLVAGDPHQLRERTRELLAQRPSVTEAGALIARLGIRAHAARPWILSIEGLSIKNGEVVSDHPTGSFTRVPAAAAGQTTANGLPIRRPGERPAAAAALNQPEPVYNVTDSARCFRSPDGRWWQRIDVTADHLNGAPVTVPPGYASLLGLRPGRLLSITGPGADLIVLVWRDQPAFDSLRPLLRRLSAQPGDRVFISVVGDQLDARRLPAAELRDDRSPAARALHLIGYTAPATTEEAVQIIARRIGTDAQISPQELIERLGQRGDNDILTHLRESLYATTHERRR
ncbi:hypothetical protein [Allonocardiopsis opalescens]|uniref:Uncharacterized protein n=1 Tax=Allonocardiopsis opalescens TaxID=1144618 RepID=A0A2T0PUE2_9ACTN|nr:hypothetical protein [Allonocardiopsis opalescens]PRX92511.1 hypothetical protein CLV72_110273 [Allonocardiopsis opalescens]